MPLPTGSTRQQQQVSQSSPGSTAAAGANDSRPSHKKHVATKGTPKPQQTDPLPSTLNTTAAPAHDAAADAALYKDMRAALAEFESQQRKLASTPGSSSSRPARMEPRQTAFHAALRSVLQQVLAETTPAGRHTRLLAAHAWYVGHRPRPVAADAGLAAAMAASLSIGSGTAGQQQPQQRAGLPSQDR